MKSSWVKNNLGYQDGLEIYQDKEMFNYSVDTILLGNFCSLNRKIQHILEVGTNNGALSIFIANRANKIHIDALEIQKEACELALYNVKMNNLENKINIIHGDFNQYVQYLCNEIGNNRFKKYQLIVANPPYYNELNNIKRKNTNKFKEIATHEITLNLEQLISKSSKIIEQKGYLAIVLPMSRFIDCISLMRKYNFEPKRIQLVYPRVNDVAKFCLVEARFNTGWGTYYLENIYLHPQNKNNHVYTQKVKKLYKPIKIEE
ncbi:tRNA1(Val) (adenine(37)-N6)-methyltransferase [Mycoplasma miroungirhinis]|uniref:tRNA1(Val) (Adenine(37)-N6)-methyltransferase n=1 Tax=Mycoplasma miroungirhinis TaxID=754516 RepID=A0A6M4JI52_9MOLU|nr:tRNA1(Val) (adenine(37)-N6)-methyltransferase [Mycoplasma miroungirhinis]QJR44131.1 tRNA1(Val) (adenine(37)-N6)-methyltransferase [Mycoplasma miroungirhinis]